MTGPMLTQREATAACGVSRSTIRRHGAEDLPGAVSDETRGWFIPVDDLLAAGFLEPAGFEYFDTLRRPLGKGLTPPLPAGETGLEAFPAQTEAGK